MNMTNRIREFRDRIIDADESEVEAMFGNFLERLTREGQKDGTHYILGISLNEDGGIEDYGYAKLVTSEGVQVLESSVTFDESELLVYLPAHTSIEPETLRGAIVSEISREFAQETLREHGIST